MNWLDLVLVCVIGAIVCGGYFLWQFVNLMYDLWEAAQREKYER